MMHFRTKIKTFKNYKNVSFKYYYYYYFPGENV